MPDLDVIILCANMDEKHKTMASHESHVHYGDGCYLNILGAGLKDPKGIAPPFLLFQEGNAIPKAAQRADDDLIEKTFTVPQLKAVGSVHGGPGINWGKYINLKTIPFIILGVAVLAYLLSGSPSW